MKVIIRKIAVNAVWNNKSAKKTINTGEVMDEVNHHGWYHSRPSTTKNENSCPRGGGNSIFKVKITKTNLEEIA